MNPSPFKLLLAKFSVLAAQTDAAVLSQFYLGEKEDLQLASNFPGLPD